MSAVLKAGTCIPVHANFDWVERWLVVWARHETHDDTDLDVPGQAAGVLPGGFWGYRDPLDEWEKEGEHRAVDMIQAELNDMPDNESSAVRHIKLGTSYTYTMATLESAYLRAKMKIGIRLHRGDFS